MLRIDESGSERGGRLVGDDRRAEGGMEGERQGLPVPSEDGAGGHQCAQRGVRDDEHGGGLQLSDQTSLFVSLEPAQETERAGRGGVEGGVEVEGGGGAEEILAVTVEDRFKDGHEEVDGVSTVSQSLKEDPSELQVVVLVAAVANVAHELGEWSKQRRMEERKAAAARTASSRSSLLGSD